MPVQTAVEPLLQDTSIQGTSPFRGHKVWPGKNFHQQQFILLSSNLRLCYPQLAEVFYVGNNTVMSLILKLAEVKKTRPRWSTHRCSHNVCIFTPLKGRLYSGETDTFSGS